MLVLNLFPTHLYFYFCLYRNTYTCKHIIYLMFYLIYLFTRNIWNENKTVKLQCVAVGSLQKLARKISTASRSSSTQIELCVQWEQCASQLELESAWANEWEKLEDTETEMKAQHSTLRPTHTLTHAYTYKYSDKEPRIERATSWSFSFYGAFVCVYFVYCDFLFSFTSYYYMLCYQFCIIISYYVCLVCIISSEDKSI